MGFAAPIFMKLAISQWFAMLTKPDEKREKYRQSFTYALTQKVHFLPDKSVKQPVTAQIPLPKSDTRCRKQVQSLIYALQ
jgi:ABC-type lipoprotein export system ATPase subunit